MGANYSWGVDGNGRKTVCKRVSSEGIASPAFCHVYELIDILEHQEKGNDLTGWNWENFIINQSKSDII